MLKKIQSDVNNCEQCEVGRRKNKKIDYKLPFDLKHADSKVMFIGICPGKRWVKLEEEGKNPRPVRRQDFINLLKKTGIDTESFYGTNIVKCVCTNLNGKNRNPIVSEILNCSRFLQKEIDVIKPKLIVTIGRIPGECFGIQKFGTIVENNELKCKIFPLRHYSNQRNGRKELLTQIETMKAHY
ncbi:MAG: hypothetical protein HY266_07825 [Deltaproteobacteria bacterium]|nr:hypothetical protein [Deltaproteobacteria bacterium]